MRTPFALFVCLLVGCTRTQSASLGSAQPGTGLAQLDGGAGEREATDSDEQDEREHDEDGAYEEDREPAEPERDASAALDSGGATVWSDAGEPTADAGRSADAQLVEVGESDAAELIDPLCIREPWHCL